MYLFPNLPLLSPRCSKIVWSHRCIIMKKSVKIPKEIGNYIIDEDSVIGKGSYGKIHFASRRGSDAKIACKVISKKPLINLSIYNESMMKETQEQFEREITFHQKLKDNNHIVKLYDYEQDKDAYYLFMEYCDSDMGKLIDKKKRLAEEEVLNYIKQLCLGYSEIYVLNASHRDLKPENLLLQNGVLKIGDFGFVKELNAITQSITRSLAKKADRDKLRASTLCGTPEYIPPNAIEAQSNSRIIYDPEKFDMWSIGIIFYYFICGRRPFEGQDHSELFNSIQHKPLQFPEDVHITEHTKDIIKKLLNKNEEERLQFRLLMKELGLPQPSKEKRMKGYVEREQAKKGFAPIQEEMDFDKMRRLINNRIRYLEFLNNLIKIIYSISSQSAIFKRVFKEERFKYYSYKLILRLHELRVLKISTFQSENYPKKVTSEISLEHKDRLAYSSETIDEFHRLFYDSIKATCGLTDEPFQQLQYLLKCLKTNTKAMEEYQCYDEDIIRMLMLALALESYIQKKFNLERLLEHNTIQDQAKMCDQISKLLK